MPAGDLHRTWDDVDFVSRFLHLQGVDEIR